MRIIFPCQVPTDDFLCMDWQNYLRYPAIGLQEHMQLFRWKQTKLFVRQAPCPVFRTTGRGGIHTCAVIQIEDIL